MKKVDQAYGVSPYPETLFYNWNLTIPDTKLKAAYISHVFQAIYINLVT